MDQTERIKLKEALQKVCKDYNVKDASFCGVTDTGVYMIISICGPKTLKRLMSTITTVGRLWQHARQSMIDVLDGFEGDL